MCCAIQQRPPVIVVTWARLLWRTLAEFIAALGVFSGRATRSVQWKVIARHLRSDGVRNCCADAEHSSQAEGVLTKSHLVPLVSDESGFCFD